MTTLIINGKNVTVSDEFLNLSPEEQNATVDEIAQQMGVAPTQRDAMDNGMGVLSAMSSNPEVMAKSVEASQAQAKAEELRAKAGQPQAPYDPGAGGAFLGAIAPGLTFGAADEIAAGIGSLFEDRSYDEILAGLRKQEASNSEQHPWASLAGNMTGAVVPGALAAKGIAAAKTLPGMVASGMGYGAAGGAAQGFLTGEGGLENRMVDAAIGAGVGGALGGAIPLVGAGVRRLARAGSDALRNSSIGGKIADALNVSPNTGRVVGNLLSPEDPAAMRAALDRAGPNAMLADASPIGGQMLDATMRSPTTGAKLAGERIAARAGTAGDDIVDALSLGMQGPKQGVASTMDSIRSGTAGARSTAYDAAYSMPIDYASPAGAKLLDEVSPRLPGSAIKYANDLMKLNGEKSGQIMASIADDGTVTFTRPPDVRQWDYIKQALDGLAEGTDGTGAMGRQTRMGAAYEGLAKEIRDNVASVVPEYRTALDTASDAITRRNAVKFGADLLSPNVTTEEALSEIATATGGQKKAMQDGFRSQMDEVLGNVKAIGSDQNIDARQALKAFTDLSSPNTRRKMEALFGDDWPAIAKTLDEASAAIGLRARTAANSATNQRGVVQEAITDAVTPGAAMRGRPLPALGDAWATLMNANPDAIKRIGRDVQGEIADLLTRPGAGPDAVNAIVAALSKNPVNTKAGKATSQLIEALLFGSIGKANEKVTGRLRGQAQ